MEIKEFRGEYFFLSNFYEAPVTYNGLTYLNSEAAFQSMKCSQMEQKVKFCTMSPSEAKAKGKRVKLIPVWENIKTDVMYGVVKAKFEQNADLRRMLLNTGDAILEEGNMWHDNYYGSCNCPRCRGIKGENILGKILMRVREELK